MRLTEIIQESSSSESEGIDELEARFDLGMQKIESGEWDEAYKVFTKLAELTLVSDLVHTARMASRILNPANSPEDKAKRIIELMPLLNTATFL